MLGSYFNFYKKGNMAKPRKNRFIISPSVSLEVMEYLKDLSRQSMNASQEVDDAVRALKGFKQYIKEQDEKSSD